MHPTERSGANVVAAGTIVDHCEAAVQQERLLSRTLKQSQGATAQGVAGNNKARTPRATCHVPRMSTEHCEQLMG